MGVWLLIMMLWSAEGPAFWPFLFNTQQDCENAMNILVDEVPRSMVCVEVPEPVIKKGANDDSL